MNTPEDSASATPQADGLATGLAAAIGVGAVGTVLIAVPSALFDLDRFTIPKELALYTTALVAGVMLLYTAGTRARLGVSDTLLAALTLWSVLSALFATNRWLGLRGLAITAAGLTVHLAARRAAQAGAGNLLRALLVVGLAAAALTGLAQAYGVDLPVLAKSRAPGGTLGNRNFLAHLMVIGLPIAGLAFLEARSRIGTAVLGATLAAMTAVTVLSRSRAAWLGGLVALAVMVLAAVLSRGKHGPTAPPGRHRRAALAVALGIAVALLVPNTLDWRSASPYSESMRQLTNYREGSGRGRVIQYRNSLRLVARDPVFGTGPGNWPVLYPLVTSRGDPSFAAMDPMPTNPWPSSDWVAILVERGPVAAALGLAAGLAMVLTGLRRLRGEDAGDARRAIALLGLLTATLITGAFDAVLLLATPMLFAGAGAGLLLPATGTFWAPRLPSRRRRLALAGVLGIGAVFRAGGQTAAIVHAGSGRSVARLVGAASYDPSSYRIHLMIAQRTPCSQARSHAAIAMRLFPYLTAPRRRLEECRR
jgi:O-antigen ligase